LRIAAVPVADVNGVVTFAETYGTFRCPPQSLPADDPQIRAQHFFVTPDTSAPGTIRGLIVGIPDSTPLFGVVLSIQGTRFQTGTDAEGRFEFVGMPAGFHFVRVLAPRYYRSTGFPVTLAADRGLRIRGGLVPE